MRDAERPAGDVEPLADPEDYAALYGPSGGDDA